MKQSTLLKNRKGEYKMLFFKKKKENKKTDILIEKDVPSLKEISINYDTEKLNMKLTNLNQSSWLLYYHQSLTKIVNPKSKSSILNLKLYPPKLVVPTMNFTVSK